MSVSQELEQKQSDSHALPYYTTSDGCRVPTAPVYEYGSLNLENADMRFLVLQPCSGDKQAPENFVKCCLEVQALSRAEAFVAIKNARGYRLLQEVIEVDSRSLIVSAALERLLRHLRQPDKSVRLWVRYICIDQANAEEMSKFWTRTHQDAMYDKAASVVDMSSVLSDLRRRGIIDKVVDTRYREWDKKWSTITPELPLPKVYPAKLGKKFSIDHPLDNHEYVPLDTVADEIRVIVIAANADPEAPLVLHLGYCPIASEVAYHALSYTWGIEMNETDIVVSGQQMKIRKNLERALLRLRSPTHGTAIWADAICINQADVEEKNQQIPRIAQIWDKAMSVACFVGEPDNHSDLALDFVKRLQKPVWWRPGNDLGAMEPGQLPRLCAALYLFLMRPYFRRVWIIQEIALASNPFIACGDRRDILFEELECAAANLQDMLSDDPELREKMKLAVPELEEVSLSELLFVRKLFYFRHLHVGKVRNGIITWGIGDTSPGYLESVILARDFQATLPHDKIFALWNIVRDKGDLTLNMDYSKSFEETYIDFAKAWSRHTGSLDIIGAVEFVQPGGPEAFYAKAPSWCPDWRRPSLSSSLIRREVFREFKMEYQDDIDGALYSADGHVKQDAGNNNTSNDFFSFDGHTLNCLGVILDHIQATVPAPDNDSIEAKVAGLIPATERFFAQHNLTTYPDLKQAMIAMFHGDVEATWPTRENNPKNIDSDHPDEMYVCIPYSRKLSLEKTPNSSRHVPVFGGHYSRKEAWDAMCTVMRGRKAFITQNGYIGLMPDFVDASVHQGEEGLCLAILATCSVPVLLREHPEIKGAYRLLGTCFVQGWMEGEVLTDQMGCEDPKEFWDAMAGSTKLKIL